MSCGGAQDLWTCTGCMDTYAAPQACKSWSTQGTKGRDTSSACSQWAHRQMGGEWACVRAMGQ